jgi:homoserine trans-succinylase
LPTSHQKADYAPTTCYDSLFAVETEPFVSFNILALMPVQVKTSTLMVRLLQNTYSCKSPFEDFVISIIATNVHIRDAATHLDKLYCDPYEALM